MFSALKILFFAILSGIILALAHPFPWVFDKSLIIDLPYQGLLALVSFVPLLIALRNTSPTSQYLGAYLFFFAANFFQLSWIFVALYNYRGLSAQKSLGFLVLAAALLSLSSAIAFPLSSWLERKANWPRWLAFPIAFCSVEWIRGHFPWGGFPLGNLSDALVSVQPIAQTASIFGMYGLVFFGALVNACIAELAEHPKRSDSWIPTTVLSVSLLLAFSYGLYSLKNPTPHFARSLKVGLLQPNVSLKVKEGDLEVQKKILIEISELQKKAIAQNVDLIVWPETAFPGFVSRDKKRITRFDSFKKPTVIGAITAGDRIDERGTYTYDSALLIDGDGKILDIYDKMHLIPIAEFLPWIAKLILFGPLVPYYALFPGKEIRPVNITVGDIQKKVGFLICYDGLYPNVSRELVLKGAQLLVQLSSEAWFIASAAPQQFLNMYRLRAIETGRTFVRAANNGVSGWIDPKGVLHDSSKMEEKTVVVSKVQFSSETTIYMVAGDFVPLSCCAAVILVVLAELLARLRYRRLANLLYARRDAV